MIKSGLDRRPGFGSVRTGLVLGGALALGSGSFGQTITVGLGAVRSISVDFFGDNGQGRGDINWDDPALQAALPGLNLSLLRFPAGTGGNYWDWNSGTFLTNYPTDGYTSSSSTYPSPLSELQTEIAVSKAGAPDFVLNMLTDPTAASPATFSPSSPNLSYQLAMLAAAQKLGLVLPYLELGNEYYLSNMPGYTTVYPDPSSSGSPVAAVVYGQLATQWIAAIRSWCTQNSYPMPKIAAVGTFAQGAGTGTRRGVWNAGLFQDSYNVGGTGAALQGEDGVTMHVYSGSNLPTGTTTIDAAAAANMLAEPFITWTSIQNNDLTVIPSSVPVWVTEYNLKDENSPTFGTWTHGLYVATMSLLFLENSRIQMALHHCVVANAVYADLFGTTTAFTYVSPWTAPVDPPATTPYGQSATAVAQGEINLAANGQSQARQLSFAGAPSIADSNGDAPYSSLLGWCFSGGSASALVILNLDSAPQTVNVSSILAAGTFVQTSGAPGTYGTGGLSGSPTNLVQTTGAVTNPAAFSLPAFSITRLVVDPLAFAVQPVSVTLGSGQTASFYAPATGTGTVSYQWYVNGTTAISGATDPYLEVSNPSATATYTCIATDSTGATASASATLTLSSSTDLGRLTNVSVRTDCGTGSANIIAGFVIGGSGTNGSSIELLIRADGPELGTLFGVPDSLPDPSLDVFNTTDSPSVSVGQNTGWCVTTTNENNVVAAGSLVYAFPLTTNSASSATVLTLPSDQYTENVTGASGDTGIALAEIYDVTNTTNNYSPVAPRLINVSARANVTTGAGNLIAGFTIGGSTDKTVLVRGTGPGLAEFSLGGLLDQPTLAVYSTGSGNTLVATNTGWAEDPVLASAANSVYAFAQTSSADCSLLVTLPPGTYTANLNSDDGGSGLALVEVYEVP